jgi:hypothetical protein
MRKLHDPVNGPCDDASLMRIRSNGLRDQPHKAQRPKWRSMSVLANEALVCRAIDAIWNQGDLDVADELFAPEYLNLDGVICDLVRGPEAIKISAALFRLAFPGLHVTVDVKALDLDGATIVLRWVARTKPGCPVGHAVEGDQLPFTGITRSRWVGGKIIESWTDWDRGRVLACASKAR